MIRATFGKAGVYIWLDLGFMVRVTLIPSFLATCSQIQCEDQYFACILTKILDYINVGYWRWEGIYMVRYQGWMQKDAKSS